MARTQVNSGGIELDETLRYPVYLSLNATTQTIAVINTGSGFLYPPEGFDAWLESDDTVAIAFTDTLTASVGEVTVEVVFVPEAESIAVSGLLLQAQVGNIMVNGIEEWEVWVPVESESGKLWTPVP